MSTASPSASPEPAGSPGALLGGRYRLEDLLDDVQGARTWRATDTVLHRDVRVHTLPADDERVEDMLAAARVSATVTDPHLLRVLDADLREDIAWVISEWGEGRTLDQMVSRGVLPPDRSAWLVREAASAIAVAHRADQAHGRLAPENVMVTSSGTVRLIGFGIDAVLQGSGRRSGHYPEATDQEADLLDLAGLLYTALVGRWPGASSSTVKAAPRDARGPLRPRQVRAGVPRPLDAICDRLLTRGLSTRTARQLAALLTEYIGELATADPDLLPTPEPEVSGLTPIGAPAASAAPVVTAPADDELTTVQRPGDASADDAPPSPVESDEQLDGQPDDPSPSRPGPVIPAPRRGDESADPPARSGGLLARLRGGAAAPPTTDEPVDTVEPTESTKPSEGDDPTEVTELETHQRSQPEDSQDLDEPDPPVAEEGRAHGPVPPPPAPELAPAPVALSAPYERPLFAPESAPGRSLPHGLVAASATEQWGRRDWAEEHPDPEWEDAERRRSEPAWPMGEDPEDAEARSWEGERSHHWLRLPLLIVLVALLVVLVTFVLAYRGGRGGAADTPPAAAPSTSVGAADGQVLRIVSVRDFDPFGNPPSENPETVGNVDDGKLRTTWQTTRYRGGADLGGLKPGVGVLIDLGTVRRVGSVAVDLVGRGTSLSLLAAPTSSPEPTGIEGLTRLATENGAGQQAVLNASPPTRARYVVVWLTRLPAVTGGFRGEISELTVRS